MELRFGENTEFDRLIKDLWKEKEVFLWYKIEAPNFKEIFGNYGLILTYNKDRFERRRRPPPYKGLLQPFNPEGFHFNKLKPEEIILRLIFPFIKSPQDHLVIAINVSPIFRYHSLLIPYPLECKPQVFDSTSIRMMLHLSFQISEANFIILGNSLLAHATVNHLHFHLLYPDFLPPSCKARGEKLTQTCMLLKEYFFPGFLFEVTMESIEKVSDHLTRLIDVLIEKNIPHNIVVCSRSNSTRLVLVFPRKPTLGKCESEAGLQTPPFFLASGELAGIIVLSHGIDVMNEKDCVEVMNQSMLDENTFFELVEIIRSILV